MSNEKKMTGYKCKNCGRIGHVPGKRCLNCKGTEFEEIDLGNKAKLLTYTQVYNPPAGVDVDPPLMIGLVEFPNGVKAMGQLDIELPEKLEIGMKLKPVWGKLREIQEKEVYGFKFELVK
ncbi:MAG: Zn-ribbon domain-containing OB-fold protein [Hadesarchaea archaeon]|nr:Zn-ribbon domain-containing OB-fold protein [Hadesarchaea archaeon]